MSVLFFILGLILLSKGAGLFVDGASFLSRRLGMSDLVIGLTVVAFGTSAPELFVNLNAALSHNPQIAIGNIIGSNTGNILLILGISAWIYPLQVHERTVWREVPLTLFAAVLLIVLANDTGLERPDGVILLIFFAGFLWYLFKFPPRSESIPSPSADKSLGKILLITGAGLLMLIVGGRVLVSAAVETARAFRISEETISLTIVALGTSLPELFTSVAAALRKNTDIAVGNIVGSNIFNIFFILGVTAFVSPLPFSPLNHIDTLVTGAASIGLFLFMFTGGRKCLDRWEGIVFVGAYVVYLGYVFVR